MESSTLIIVFAISTPPYNKLEQIDNLSNVNISKNLKNVERHA